jgi:hypothetical protein
MYRTHRAGIESVHEFARTRGESTLSQDNGTWRFVEQEADVPPCRDETQLLLFKPYFA